MPDSPQIVPLRRRFSMAREFYSGSFLCSPIWYGVLTMMLVVAPKTVTISLLTGLQKDQFGDNAYWITTAAMVLQALASAPALALLGNLSQPHRWGRKNVLLLIILMSVVSSVVPAFTLNAYVIVAVQTVVSFLGADRMGSGVFVILLSWCTDWCQPEHKTTYFAIVFGSLFGTVALSPYIPSILQIKDDRNIWNLAAVMSAVAPILFALIFPKEVPCMVSPPSPSTLRRRFSLSSPARSDPAAPEPSSGASPSGASKTMEHIGASLKYLFTRRFSPTVIYLLVNLTDSAVADSCSLFLQKERGFSVDEYNIMIIIPGVSGFLCQCILIPALGACGVAPTTMLLIGTIAMVAHFSVYAFVVSKVAIEVLEPLSAVGYIAIIAATAIVSGGSDPDDVPRDQGTLIGVLNGLKLAGSCVGPLILASLTSTYEKLPAPFNFSGMGFAVMTAVMFVAVVLAFQLRFCLRDKVATCSDLA